MDQEVEPSQSYSGIIQIPPSKSDSQRAILAASLANGKSLLKNVGVCQDELAMLGIVKTLGATLTQLDATSYEIVGVAQIPEKVEVNVNESGLAARLLSGVFAVNKGNQRIVGKGSVLQRKMAFYFKHQEVLKCNVESAEDYALPLTFNGSFDTSNIQVNGGESSQDISGLLYGLVTLKEPVELYVHHLKSRPYLQMTLDTLAQFGVEITHENYEHFTIPPHEGLQACEYEIEGDWSSASFWLVASALGKDIFIDGLQIDSLQADKQLLNILRESNCLEVRGQYISLDGKERTPLDCDLTHSPDLFPALTAYASLTPGISKLAGVHRLFNKESNRAAVLMEEFSKLGVTIWVENDTLFVKGCEEVRGGTVKSHNDHRIAMALAVVGMFANSPVIIEQSEAVNKSYPQFWEHLEGLKQQESVK